ncbi:MAG: CpaF family protein [Coriobacteriia bacterium]|nr:CpaF family protein [Coriobacteriia bacterium]
MSLTERVERGRPSDAPLVEGSVQTFEDGLFTEFKEAVSERMPPQRMARLIERNPLQARSEIRLTCEEVLSDCPWLVRGQTGGDDFVGRFLDSVFGLGPLEPLIADESITEVMVNGSRSLFIEREGVLVEEESSFANDEQVQALIDRILAPLGRRVDESSPMVNARLPQGHRVNAVIPPLALDGPILTIRKFRSRVLSLSEMKGLGSFDDAVLQLMAWAVLRRCNVAVSGGTGSGKTTLLNALSCVIPEGERIVTIEDSAELRFFEHPHVVRLEARPRNAEGLGEVTIRDLVINSLRMRPDRIVVGECRGAEALDMLQAMNTGHDGSLTTLHANSPSEAIGRLTTMVRYGAELPVSVIESQIASAIDLVIQTSRLSSGRRRVTDIVGFELDGQGRCRAHPYYSWDVVRGRGLWVDVPAWVEELPYVGVARKEEVEAWKSSLSYSH